MLFAGGAGLETLKRAKRFTCVYAHTIVYIKHRHDILHVYIHAHARVHSIPVLSIPRLTLTGDLSLTNHIRWIVINIWAAWEIGPDTKIANCSP